MNIPIYRAKKIDSDEYIKGYYVYVKWCNKHFIHTQNNDIVYEIDPSTLSIKTPEIDFFMSLDVKTGKGGDIIQLQDGTKETMECVFYRGRASYKDNAGRFHWCIHYKNVNVIGIQE